MIEGRRTVEFPVIKITQPIGDFYVGVMSSKDLVDIAHFDIRQIRRDNKGTDTETLDNYLGIQRQLSASRVNELAEYVNSLAATFPSAVILAVEERCAQLLPLTVAKAPVPEATAGDVAIDEPASSTTPTDVFLMRLQNHPGALDDSATVLFREIARVIDGQHRIAGLFHLAGDKPFEINVAVFVGADISDQAAIFSTVNLAQTKVNRSLVYDLLEYSKTRSPERTCHEIAVVLDQKSESPFKGKIKRLGVATEGRFGETLSQATVVRGILQYVSKNYLRDRDTGARHGRWPPVSDEEANQLIFRRWFVQNEDEKILAVVWNYFSAVSRRWPHAWASSEAGMMLNRTNGFRGFVRFLRPAYLKFAPTPNVVSEDEFDSLFASINLQDADFTRTKFAPGTSGETDLFKALMQLSKLDQGPRTLL